jgi:hypothetical protein
LLLLFEGKKIHDCENHVLEYLLSESTVHRFGKE